jgi:hypothetical protein
MTRAQFREAIRVLEPPVAAFERAKRRGLVSLDDEGRLFCIETLDPGSDDDPAQLPLFF